MAEKQRIMIVDDDENIAELISLYLMKECFETQIVHDGEAALKLRPQFEPDLILLDLMLPGLDGEAVMEHINGIPVIILSAKSEVEDKIHLLNVGACDYITKPFHRKELIARILVQLRKGKASGNRGEDSIVEAGELSLDPLTLHLTARSRTVTLTKTECSILRLLMMNARYTLSRDTLLDSISLETPDCTEQSLKQHI